MKRITTVLCLVLVCSLLFCGCSKKDDDTVTSPSPEVSPLVSDMPENDNSTHGGDLTPDDNDGLVDDEDGLIDDGNGSGEDGTAVPSESPTASPAA